MSGVRARLAISMFPFKRRLLNGAILILCGFLLRPAQLEARFHHQDADEVDREEGLRSEALIDKLSYRQPWRMRMQWMEHDQGYQIGAGSTDANFFDLYEDIKLTTDPLAPVTLGFQRQRREDAVSQLTEDEVRFVFREVHSQIFLALLVDGGALKKWDDLGVALGLRAARDLFFEAYYYAVDHFYAEKEVDFPDDRYASRPWSVGVRGSWNFPGGGLLSWDAGHDAPFRWERRSHGYTYDYARRFGEIFRQYPRSC